MGITDPDDVSTPSGGGPAGGDTLPDEPSGPPDRLDDASDDGQGGDEYPEEDPSPS